MRVSPGGLGDGLARKATKELDQRVLIRSGRSNRAVAGVHPWWLIQLLVAAGKVGKLAGKLG